MNAYQSKAKDPASARRHSLYYQRRYKVAVYWDCIWCLMGAHHRCDGTVEVVKHDTGGIREKRQGRCQCSGGHRPEVAEKAPSPAW